MGRITINGTQAGFSCKKEVSLALWDVKTNRAKGKSEEARTLNQELDNIKAQITRHYQYICDHDSFVTAKKVYNRYVGFSEECHTLMNLFREQLEPYKKKIGIEKAESTYCGLVADYKSLLLFMKSKKNAEDIVIEELEKSFIEDYYNWMLGTCALANSTVFGRVNTLKWLMYIAQEKGWIRVHPFASFECMPEYKRRSFLSEEELQRIIHIEPRYKRQRAMRDMFLFMCFTGTSYVDVVAITPDNLSKDDQGAPWLKYRRGKNGQLCRVKLLPEAVVLIEKYKDETRATLFPVIPYQALKWCLTSIKMKVGIKGRLSYHMGRHSFSTLMTLENGVPIETVSRMLGHADIGTTQVYARVTPKKLFEDMDKYIEATKDLKLIL